MEDPIRMEGERVQARALRDEVDALLIATAALTARIQRLLPAARSAGMPRRDLDGLMRCAECLEYGHDELAGPMGFAIRSDIRMRARYRQRFGRTAGVPRPAGAATATGAS